MAQLISVKLSRFDGSPWGFRLQGGKDFGTPLVVQKVNNGSPAEAAGLKAGDAVIKVNSTDMFNLRHKDAQDVIVRAGNNFEMTIQRGGSTWRPSISPVTPTIPSPQPSLPASSISPVTKTSLAATKKHDGPLIGSGHNFTAKPFPNGTSDSSTIKSIVNKQYNSPVGIYSDQTIAETLSAQAEVLAGGVLGVNFKKNEKNYNAENSQVFKMVQEADKEPKTPEPTEPAVHSGAVMSPSPAFSGLRSVSAPETKPPPTTPPQTSLSPGQNICAECERLIVGVFVRIKEKNLHVECFKCSTCGTSLKNVGYYNINNKLYCDIHAKLVARQQASNSGYVPVTISPSGKAPASTISSALGNIQSHSPISPPPPLNGTSIPSPFSKRNNFHPSSNTDYGISTDEYDSINELSSTTNGYMLRNNVTDKRNSYNEKMYTSTITIRTGNEAHPTNISGPKPFGGISNATPISNFTLTPTSNSFGSNFTRPQSQTVTEPYYEECNFLEEEDIIETQSSVGETSRPPSSVKSKSLQWPPVKNIEDITYPTASPIWIDPNPILDRLPKHNVPDKRKDIQDIYLKKSQIINQQKEEYKREIFSRSYQKEYEEEEQEQETKVMDRPCNSCNTPFYRKTETMETQRQYRSSSVSRPDSAEGVRRSLTPTRINQPIPKPWKGSTTVDGTYGHVQAPTPPEPPVCRKVCTCQIICERTSGPAGPEHEQEHTYREIRCEICNPPPPSPQVCEESYEMQQIETQEIVEQETGNEVIDLSKVVPEDIAVCPKGVENQHNLYTETMEKDEGNLHIKKTTVYEKTVEIMSPNRAGSPVTDTRTSSAMDGEVEHLSNRKNYVDSAEFLSSTIETNRMIQEAKEENDKRRSMYEEECRREQERIRRETEEAEQREANRIRLIQAEKEEKEHRIAEQKRQTDLRCRQEEEERCNSQLNYSRNERNSEQSQKMAEEHYYKKEMKIQNNVEELNQECRQSLRQQVEVHKCLREQQIPEKRQPTLQERRIANRFRPQSPPRQETSCQRKHVQFMTDTKDGTRPLQTTPIKNATPKEWKSEMVNALTTAPERSYSPFQAPSSRTEQQETHDNYGSTKQMYSSQVRYEETCRSYPQASYDYQRPDSPFTSALTIAPDRPYTPIGADEADRKYESVICVDRSETPVNQTTPQGYCHPAEILYTDSKTRESRSRERKLTKIEGPKPLPPPPTDYKFRESSVSPARTLSRCDTPKDRSLGRTTPLKKPDTIPFYQKHLVALEQDPIEAHPYVPSRSPTPCRSKSPAVRHEESSSRNTHCPYSSSTSSSYPEKKQSFSYHMEEQTPQKCRSVDFVETKNYMTDNNSENDYKRQTYSEQYKKSEEKQAIKSYQGNDETVRDDFCEITKTVRIPPSLHCPVAPSQSSISERIQRTGVRVLPTPETTINSSSQVCESRIICHKERSLNARDSNYYPESTCPNTGVTVLPCRAISDSGSRAGIVIVPCEGESNCPQGGVRITPTPDRGLCVSPVVHGRSSNKCSGQDGVRSGGCEIDIGNCPGSGVKVATCKDGSVCIAPCKLPCNQSKPQCPLAKPLPFPHIPLPNQSEKSSYESCPIKKEQSITESMSETSCNFKPINGQPQTNLSNQLTRLTLKRDKHVVQLFKPQPQSSQCSDGVHCGESDFHNSASASLNKNSPPNHYFPKLTDKTQNSDPPNLSSYPDLGSGIGSGGDKSCKFAGSSAPKRGRGILNQAIAAGGRQPLCGHCHSHVRGPFITALGQIWCPEHFVCVNSQCKKSLHDIGFVEEKGQLYCEYCFERFIAPSCNKCSNKIKGDCLNAIGRHFHPECFSCAYCGKLFGNSPFFLEDGLPYCEADWNELFTTKCFACGFPVEAGDRWVEALNNNYHSQCFNCTMCKKNLEGQSFYAKGGRPFCKNHAR